MKKKLIGLAFLVGGLLVVYLATKQINGIMFQLLQEIHEKITSITFEGIKQQFSGDADSTILGGYAWNLGFIVMWFVFQWIMLTRCRHVVVKIIPLVITVALWILAEVLNTRGGSADFTAYALCYATLHWMIGAWVACFLWCIRLPKDLF